MILAVANQAAVTGVLLAVLAAMIVFFVRHEDRKSQRTEEREQKAGSEEDTSFGPDWDSSVEEEESRSVTLGFTPRHTAEYQTQGHSPHTTQVWEDDEWSIPHRARPEGFTPEEAKLWREAGYTAREARRLSQEHAAPPPRSR
jgi:hypothetical protein